MAGQTKYPALVGVLVVLCAGLLGIDQALASLNYAGKWETEEDQAGKLIQSYRHSVGAASSQELTSFLTIAEDFRYGYYKPFEEEVTEFVAPSLGVVLNNQIFRLGITGSTVEYAKAGAVSSRKLDVSWASMWAKMYWPRLNALFSQDEIVDERTTKVVDRQSRTLSTSADWSVSPLKLHYNMLVSESSSNVESTSQSGQASFSRSFWDNRVSTNLAYNFSRSDSEKHFTIPGSGVAYVTQAITGPVQTGTDAVPDDIVELTAVNAPISDSVTTTTAYPILGPSTFNNILLPVNSQNIGMIYLYTLNNLGVVLPGAMDFELYSNANLPALVPWQLEANSATLNPLVNYNTTLSRFEIKFPAGNLTVNYLKLVVDNNTATPIDFTEVVPLQAIPGSAGFSGVVESEIEQNNTSFSLVYKASEDVSLSYNLSLGVSSFDSFDVETSSHQAALNYRPIGADYGGVLQVSRNLTKQVGGSESENNTLGITINQTFLSTLDTAYGWSMSSLRNDGRERSASDRFFLYTNARFYPDLTANLDTDYSSIENPLLNEEISALRVDFSLTSHLKRSLSMVLGHDYLAAEIVNSSGNTEETRQNTSRLTVNWQISSLFVFSGSLAARAATGQTKVLTYGGDWRLKLTRSMEAALVYTARDGDELRETGSLNFNCGFSQDLKLRTYVSYAKTEGVPGDDLRFNSTLTFRFSPM